MRVLSGIQPSGVPHLGNYLGAIRNWVELQSANTLYCVVDLHSLTLDIDPADLRRQTVELAASLFAAGLNPDICTVFVQSHVPEHAQLSWLLECVASYGELTRMTQFKDKADRQGGSRAGLLTYPVLMAADILLYDTTHVPVGDDQRQHLELTRNIAERFNFRYGDTFVVPEGLIPASGARVMDLQDPTRKMSKSLASPLGTVGIFDPPSEIVKKVKKAVTDLDGEVRFDRDSKPGLSNLLDIFSAFTGEAPSSIAQRYERYGDLKAALAEVIVESLDPVQKRYYELLADPGELTRQIAIGAERARALAATTYARAASAMGLLPR
jgi:tryptophanyl-tRNA synthetase